MDAECPGNLTDEQWKVIEKLLPKPAKVLHRPQGRTVILYLGRAGCELQYLPREYATWNSVYTVARRRRRDSAWDFFHEAIWRQFFSKQGESSHRALPLSMAS
jgi:transposase